jgi:hypothetical protein
MSLRGTTEEKTAKSDSIYRNRLINMLVNRILKPICTLFDAAKFKQANC